MLDKIISLTEKFIDIKSDPGNAKELEQILELALSNLNEFTIERFESNGSKSALIYNSAKRPKKFKVILNGHLDVIPGKDYQYKPEIRNNRLYGVGAMDMKANLACLIMAFKETAKKVNYPMGLQIVTDEEIGGFDGTKYQINNGVRADFVIAGETTNFNIANQAKGILWIKVSCKGKTAHGAYPWKGKNAIWEMNRFFNILEKKYPIPEKQEWKTTVNLSRVETNNQTFNKIPDDCSAWFDIRYISEDANNVLPNMKKLLPLGFKIEIVEQEPALFVDENNQYLKILRKVTERITSKKINYYGAQGSSDARHFTRINCAGIEFGPVGGGIGTDNEWVNIPSLEKYYQVLKAFLTST